MSTPLNALAEHGQSAWVDHLSRRFRARLVRTRSRRRLAAAVPVGLDLDEEPGLPRRQICRGTHRPEHGHHHAPGHIRGLHRPRSRDRHLERDIDGAQRTLDRFARAGIDYDDLVATLERQGVAAFARSFQELFDGVAAKRDELITA